jgi:hypothetical protein
MPHAVDFSTVSAISLESSPVAAALAGLQANEARYFKNKVRPRRKPAPMSAL